YADRDSNTAGKPERKFRLQLFVEIARGAGDIDTARSAALTVFHALHDARRFRALRTVCAFGSVHFLFTIPGFGNLGHTSILLRLGPDTPDAIHALSSSIDTGSHSRCESNWRLALKRARAIADR